MFGQRMVLRMADHKREKVSAFIYLRDKTVFSRGLWEEWVDPATRRFKDLYVLTTAANR